jgi:hypothetical protein
MTGQASEPLRTAAHFGRSVRRAWRRLLRNLREERRRLSPGQRLPISRVIRNLFLDVNPWWDIDPAEHARGIADSDPRWLELPQHRRYRIGGQLEVGADVLYRLGAAQPWFHERLAAEIEREVRSNTNRQRIRVDLTGKICARPPGRRHAAGLTEIFDPTERKGET